MKKMFIFLRSIFFKYIALRKISDVDGKKVRVNGYTKLTNKTRLGNNVNFNGLEILGNGNVSIGDNFHSGQGCLFITQNHNYDNGSRIPYDNTYVYGDITIEDNVWLGNRTIILPGVTIGEGSIIQAGSTVVTDIPPLSIAGGHPAKVFKKRNESHYWELKNAKMFW